MPIYIMHNGNNEFFTIIGICNIILLKNKLFADRPRAFVGIRKW